MVRPEINKNDFQNKVSKNIVLKLSQEAAYILNTTAIALQVVPGQVQNSSGSGSAFRKSSGSGLTGFAFSSKVRVRVYRVSILKFGFSGLSGSGLK